MSPERHELYARLMAKHSRDLNSYIFTLHPHQNDLDDIIQEVAIKIYKNFDKYDSNLPFLPWAFRFASFEVLSFRRDKARSKLVFSDQLLNSMIDERIEMQNSLWQRQNHLGKCIEKLKKDDQQLLSWRYQSKKTIKQMAAALELPVKRLYKRLERLRLTLYQCIQHQN